MVLKLCCFTVATYVIWTQTSLFLKNKDASSIEFRHFNNEPNEEYPAFSICFVSEDGTIFDSNVKEGLEFNVFCKASFTILFLTSLLLIVSPLFFSISFNSFGRISNNKTSIDHEMPIL